MLSQYGRKKNRLIHYYGILYYAELIAIMGQKQVTFDILHCTSQCIKNLKFFEDELPQKY